MLKAVDADVVGSILEATQKRFVGLFSARVSVYAFVRINKS